ncbi:MAG: hypothetical protein OEZ01_06855 [Candidatus Heimdallarchaeota archaeon]|nr:hypothetical protein [Candidatus Heimdallarchaeota archaeon]MDH5645709.1 hypothetical protein [Candidatus Heimdallarchaeota archaeon]
MKVYVGFFSKLREKLDPKPPIGDRIEVEVEENDTLRYVASKFLDDVDEIAIIMVNGIHQSLDYQIKEDGLKVSFFPVSGGG